MALGGGSEFEALGPEAAQRLDVGMSVLDEVAGASGLGRLGHEELHFVQSCFKTRVNTQRHYHHR
jgi:hypothetical protein